MEPHRAAVDRPRPLRGSPESRPCVQPVCAGTRPRGLRAPPGDSNTQRAPTPAPAERSTPAAERGGARTASMSSIVRGCLIQAATDEMRGGRSAVSVARIAAIENLATAPHRHRLHEREPHRPGPRRGNLRPRAQTQIAVLTAGTPAIIRDTCGWPEALDTSWRASRGEVGRQKQGDRGPPRYAASRRGSGVRRGRAARDRKRPRP